MIKRNETAKNGRTKNAANRGMTSYLLVFLCGALLVSGFFFAAQQHFASMDYGMKNSRLRRQIDQLEAEKQRLIHAREVSLSPTEVKRSAKKLGLLDAPSVSTNMLASADPIEMKAARPNPSAGQPLVQKISATQPVRKDLEPSPKKPVDQTRKLVALR